MDISNQINSILDGTDRKEKYKLHGLIYKQKRAVSKENAKIRAEKERTKEWAKYGATTLEEYIKAKQKCETKMEEDNQEKEQSVKKDGPQIENGYTKIANELLEALTKAMANGTITAREGAVINYIIRYTYGFQKTNGYFKNKEMSEYFGWSKNQTSIYIKSLQDKKIIIKEQDNKYKLNKYYKEWKVKEIFNSEKKLKKSLTNTQKTSNTENKEEVKEIFNTENKLNNSLTKVKEIFNSDISQTQSQSNDADSLNKSLNKYNKLNKKETYKERNSISKKIKEEEILEIPSWLNKEVWSNFIEHRKALKKPMTPQAIKLAFKKLEEFKNQGYNPEDVINQSILNGWLGLFEPKRRANKLPTKEDFERQARNDPECYYAQWGIQLWQVKKALWKSLKKYSEEQKEKYLKKSERRLGIEWWKES